MSAEALAQKIYKLYGKSVKIEEKLNGFSRQWLCACKDIEIYGYRGLISSKYYDVVVVGLQLCDKNVDEDVLYDALCDACGDNNCGLVRLLLPYTDPKKQVFRCARIAHHKGAHKAMEALLEDSRTDLSELGPQMINNSWHASDNKMLSLLLCNPSAISEIRRHALATYVASILLE